MYGFPMPSHLKVLHALLCSTVSNAFSKSRAADPKWLVPLGGSMSELLESVQVVLGGAA